MRTLNLSFFYVLGFWALFLCSFSAKAQANYSGGQGSGYASINVSTITSVTIQDTLLFKNFDVVVFPNPIRKGDALKCRIRNAEKGSKTYAYVNDLLGNRVGTYEIDKETFEVELLLPFNNMSKGIFLITFHNGKSRVTRRVTLLE